MSFLNRGPRDTVVNLTDAAGLEREINSFDFSTGPSSTTLSGNELYLLLQSGYEPLQIVFGNVVYSMGLRGVVQSFTRALRQGEMPAYTRMNNDARVLALKRLNEKGKALGGDMVMGVIFEIRTYADFEEVIATGTAVRRVKQLTDMPIATGA